MYIIVLKDFIYSTVTDIKIKVIYEIKVKIKKIIKIKFENIIKEVINKNLGKQSFYNLNIIIQNILEAIEKK